MNKGVRKCGYKYIYRCICICIILPALCPSAVFADGFYTLSLDSVFDALYLMRFSGSYSDASTKPSTNPYPYQGEGETSAFQTSLFDKGLKGRLNFSYEGDRVGGSLQFKTLVDTTYTQGSADWDIWLRLFNNALLLRAGSQGQYGQVEDYDTFDDFLSAKIDHFGILVPNWLSVSIMTTGNVVDGTSFPYGHTTPGESYGYAEVKNSGANDLFMAAGALSRQGMGFLLDAAAGPLTFSVSAGGLLLSTSQPLMTWYKDSPNGVLNMYDGDSYDPLETKGFSIAGRVEGADLFNRLNAALVYKYAGSRFTKTEAINAADKIREKVDHHAFGIYANLRTPLDGLFVSLGYSGLAQSWENPEGATSITSMPSFDAHYLSQYRKVTLPFYSGFDLMLRYSEGNWFSVTLNNKVSFASVRGNAHRANNEQFSGGWAYTAQLNEDASGKEAARIERYFGFYNALGIHFAANKRLAFDVQAAYHAAFFRLHWERPVLEAVTSVVGLYTGLSYTVLERGRVTGSVRGGLALRFQSHSYQDINADIFRGGYLEAGIPIALKVEY
ncbi:MAG: hypothetical protein LBR16_02300 [Treponema sp.]|nr:hypothetical protein [Treponema sp.]